MALRVGSLRRTDSVAIEGIADIRRSLAARRSDANGPQAVLAGIEILQRNSLPAVLRYAILSVEGADPPRFRTSWPAER